MRVIVTVVLFCLVLALGIQAQEVAYESITLEIDLGSDFITSAELTYPADGEAPFPTVILLHGSVPYDMNSTVSSFIGEPLSANFRLLAERLAAQGIAVLRFNKRGVEANGGIDMAQVQASTLDQLVADATAVIDAAREQAQVGDIYLYGWSEGGVVAANAASDEDVAGLILQAAPNGTVGSVLPYQHLDVGLPYLAEVVDADEDGQLTVREMMTIPQGPVALMPSFYIFDATSTFANPVFNPQTDTNGDEMIDIEGELRPAIETLIENYPLFVPSGEASWEVAEVIAVLEKPTLILHGEMDGWIPVSTSEAIAEAAPDDVTLNVYEGLGHALSLTDVLGEDSFGVMSDEPITDVAEWILSQS